ncbi:MAG: hypothetical protein FWH40_06320 [Coriobacteriia bacterium]|nr:hypothetical protein [Coriobacteriia bacterium]
MESKQVPKKTKEALTKAYESLNDAEVTREIIRIQLRLLGLVTDKNMVEFINDAIAAIQVA